MLELMRKEHVSAAFGCAGLCLSVQSSNFRARDAYTQHFLGVVPPFPLSITTTITTTD